VVRGHLEHGRLHRVPGAPEFLYPAYAVFAEGADEAVIAPALAALKQAAKGAMAPPSDARKRARARTGSIAPPQRRRGAP
jgi:hypothetical protein